MREPSKFELTSIQQAFRELWADVSWLVAGTLDFKARRLQNIGKAAVPTDALPLGQAKDLFMPLGKAFGGTEAGGSTRIDTFANRGSAGAHRNELFVANDRNYVTWVSDGASWRYVAGVHQRTQAQLAALAATLVSADAGYLADVTDYDHILQWTGSAWVFQDGDGSGHVVVGKPDGSAPNGGVWGACDGTAYNVLNGDGTLTNTTTQNLTGDVFIKGAAAVSTQSAAARATWEAAAATNTEAAHTHGVGTLAAANAATGISVDAHTTAADTAVTGAGTRVTTATHTVNDPQHTHTLSGSTAAGSAHSHTLTDANAQRKVPSEANGGVPLRISVVWYMRR